MRIPRFPRTVPVYRRSPALAVDVVLERVQVVLELEVKHRRDVITPSQEIDRVSARDLVDVRHDQQVVLFNAGDAKKLIQRNSLIRFFDERVLSFPKPSSDGPVS